LTFAVRASPAKERTTLAVTAAIRHSYTDYDQLADGLDRATAPPTCGRYRWEKVPSALSIDGLPDHYDDEIAPLVLAA
jgi:hypothetical protein